MSLPDDFSSYVPHLLDGRYDWVDRIVLNGYFLMGQTSGGLLTWWNQLCPARRWIRSDVVNNVAELRCGKRLEKLPPMPTGAHAR